MWVRALELEPGANRVDVELETTSVSGALRLATAEAPANLLTRLDDDTFVITAVESDPEGRFADTIAVAGHAKLVQFEDGAVRADPDSWFTLAERELAPGVPARFER